MGKNVIEAISDDLSSYYFSPFRVQQRRGEIKRCRFPEGVTWGGKTPYYPIVEYHNDSSRVVLCQIHDKTFTIDHTPLAFVPKDDCLAQRGIPGVCFRAIPETEKEPKLF